MRLNRLDLTRYGKFTDHVIDFGKAENGQPDFHIVYGLNEAGKSTTFAAYLDLLFGMHQQTPYNFLHPYGSMRIGAQLEIDGAVHELARLKQRTGSLVDARGTPVNDALLVAALGGITRDAYRTMFSLDDQSLKEGGNAIIQSKGELGELLFSASSGLAGLSKSLAAATEEAASVYKKRSSSTRLAELKRALETLKTERNAIDTFAAAHAALSATHLQATSAYDAAAVELAAAKTRHAELTRILAALPLALDLARLANDPANQIELPRPPSEWFALLPQLSRDETRLQALLQEKDRGIEQLSGEIDAIVIDEKGLAIASAMDMLGDGIARFRSAENDLPKRRQSLFEQQGALSRLLVDLERPADENPESLLLPTSVTAIIHDLLEKRSGVEARLAAAKRELQRSHDSLRRIEEDHDADHDIGNTLDEGMLAKLESGLARLTASDLVSRLAIEERARTQLQRKLESHALMLAPWSGNREELAATPTADARQIELWRNLATSIDRRVTDHRDRHRAVTTELVTLEARFAAFTAGGAIGDAEAQSVRADRDAAWQAHIVALDRASALTFEEALRRDDVLSHNRLARAHELAELRHLNQKIAETRAAIERERELLDEASTEQSALGERIAAQLPDELVTEPDALQRLATLESWSSRRADTLSVWTDLEQVETTIADLSAELTSVCAELETALVAAGADNRDETTPQELSRAASALVTRLKSGAAAKAGHAKTMADLARDVAERERDLSEAQEDADKWQEAWQQALSKTWLSDKAGSIAAIRDILQELAKLPAILKDCQELTQRVTAMERDQARFRHDLENLLGKLDEDRDIDDPLALANRLLERQNAARRQQQTKSDRQLDLEKLLSERADLSAELAVHNARKGELTAYFGTDTLASVAGFLDQARERERVEARMAELREQIAQSLRVPSFEAAQQHLQDIDAEATEQEAMELATRIDDLTERARELYADMTRAKDKLDAVGGDDAVARIEAKRKTIFLEIEDLATRYLTLKTGILAAEKALHIYRDKHRSSMMNRASEAFSLITGGNYSGLATQVDKDKEILIGVARDGSSKLAEDMSTGTQFQLYLALRLAGYEEFAAVRPAVPFIADDIMESFDNPRSEEVFRLLGDMSKVGQVIYLTHHWHLCEIAQSVVPDVKIHKLP